MENHQNEPAPVFDPGPWVSQGERSGYWRAIGHLLFALAIYGLGIVTGWFFRGIADDLLW